MKAERTIWTIGHSTRSIDEFIEMLKAFNIQTLVDIRHFPGSRRYPHFNKDQLNVSLEEKNIRYVHMEALGGRRKPLPDSKNTVWKHTAFRGYADHMESDEFKQAINALEELAERSHVAYMCSEAVWWSCHRALVSDLLKSKGWRVMHIMSAEKQQEHPYTSAARIKNGSLSYTEETLF